MELALTAILSYIFAALTFISRDHMKCLLFLTLSTFFISITPHLANTLIEIALGLLAISILYFLVLNTEKREREFYFEKWTSIFIVLIIPILSFLTPYPFSVALIILGFATLILKKDLVKCVFGIQILQCGLFSFIHEFGKPSIFAVFLLNIASLLPLALLALVSINIYKNFKTLDRRIVWRRYA